MLGIAKVPAQEQPYLLGHKPPQLVSSSKNIWWTLCTATLPLVRTSGSLDLTDIGFELVKLGLILWSEHTAEFIMMNRLFVVQEQSFSYLLQIHASMSVRCCEGAHSSCSILSASCRYRPSTKGQDAASTRTHTHTHTTTESHQGKGRESWPKAQRICGSSSTVSIRPHEAAVKRPRRKDAAGKPL